MILNSPVGHYHSLRLLFPNFITTKRQLLHHHQTSETENNAEKKKKFAIYFLILHRLEATASIHSCWNKIRFKKYLNLRWIIPKVYIRNHHSKWYRHEFADLIFVFFFFSSLIYTTTKKKSWTRRGKWITEQW